MNWKYLLKGCNNKQFKILALFFLALYIFHLYVSISHGVWHVSLWFCATLLLFLAIGLYYDNLLLISGIVTSSVAIEIVWVIDIITYSFTGSLGIGIATYLTDLSITRYILTFYHFFLLALPLTIVLLKRNYHKFSWVFSSVHLFLIAGISFLFTNTNINCVRGPCEIGILTVFYTLKPSFLSFLLFNWVLLSILIFIPTHLILYYLIKKSPKPHTKKSQNQS